ncbi:aminodeoxychorismate lyase [Psychrosphaera aestuarii]|uniref:aminodeoxychorismate lyase n=1 Tax=Psychrosphaera aestuarii TaxID=1266052 RepID=UPI001B3234E3|nr:aminodeoxychorismate lyase [Psychrosphaera aestuarii]
MTFNCYDNNLNLTDCSKDWFEQRSFLFGDGHFTTTKVELGRILDWPLHLKRLQVANDRLKVASINWQKLSELASTHAQQVKNGIIKIQISRGTSVRGYQVSNDMTPYVFITTTSTQLVDFAKLKAPVELNILDTKLGINPSLAGLKHGNRLEQALISCELNDKMLTDGIVADINGHVIETAKANLFWFDGKQWHTPLLNHCGIAGIVREKILTKIPFIKADTITEQKLIENAEAMFICNSILGIVPVSQLANKKLQLAPSAKIHAEVFHD